MGISSISVSDVGKPAFVYVTSSKPTGKPDDCFWSFGIIPPGKYKEILEKTVEKLKTIDFVKERLALGYSYVVCATIINEYNKAVHSPGWYAPKDNKSKTWNNYFLVSILPFENPLSQSQRNHKQEMYEKITSALQVHGKQEQACSQT
jgi:hypothetical protein